MGKQSGATKEAGLSQLTREQVLRLLSVSDRQLSAWERRGWIRPMHPCPPPAVSTPGGAAKARPLPRQSSFYTFSDIAALRTVLRLRRSGVPASRLRLLESVLTSPSVAPGGAPLSRAWNDLQIQTHGKRLSVGYRGRRMEPLTGQFLLDFMQDRPLSRVRSIRGRRHTLSSEAERAARADRLFLAGLRYEENPESVHKAIRAYQKATELNPRALGAFINLGTIFYHQGAYDDAEESYRAALALNPGSALVHFNLGNLLEERGRLEEASSHYLEAVHLDPGYPDPRFNLALVYERLGRHGKACQQWRAYLRLDSSSRWASYARQRLDQLPLRVVPSSPAGEQKS